jgi:hypothetical protein
MINNDRNTLPPGYDIPLNTEQASLYIGLAKSTLEKLRVSGGGPVFEKYSRKAVRYRIADLDAWRATRRMASTSEGPLAV